MATIKITTSNIALTSTWRVTEDLGGYYSTTPTLASGSRTFDLSAIPRGSVIHGATLSANRYGSGQVRTMDGQDLTAAQQVAADRITPGGTLTIQFRYRANGGGTSVGSHSATAGWLNITLTVEYTAYTTVTAPTEVTLPKNTATPEETLRLSWSGAQAGMNNAITGYQVYRADSADGAYTLLASTAAGTLYLDVTAPAAPASYFYKVKALGAVSGYDSGLSAVYAALAMNVTAPAAPAGLALSQSSQVPGGSVTLSWNASAGGQNNPVTGYAVYSALNENGPFAFLKNAEDTSTAVAARQEGTVYFKVKALGAYAESPLSTGSAALQADMSTTSDFSAGVERVEAGRAVTLALTGSTAAAHTAKVTVRGSASTITQQYSFPGGSDTLTFTPPLSWLSALPNSAEAPMEISLATDGGGVITKSILLSCPESAGPLVAGAAASPVSAEIPGAWGVYVAGKSRASISLSAAAQGQYGAAIVSYGITGNGIAIVRDTLPMSAESDLLAEGARTFTVYAVDSRGKTGRQTVTVTVLPYAPPTLKSILSIRCGANGQEEDEGLYALCSAEAVIASCGGHNSAQCAVSYRRQGAESWISAGNLSNGTLVIGGELTLSDNWEIRYVITDALGGSAAYYDRVTRAQWEMHVARGGGAWAFGGVADVPGALKIYGRILAENFYPVGSIYLSVNNVNPSSLFGGIWERITDRFLLAGGGNYAIGATGGEASHTLTINEMPSHTHTVNKTISYNGTGYKNSSYVEIGNATPETSYSMAANPTGGGAPFSIMPPYLAVNVWKRTA